MNKDRIVQFVCFSTPLELDEFLVKWEHYAIRFASDTTDAKLQKSIGTGKRNKYKYISQHECGAENFRFSFIKGNADHFPDHTAAVTQVGGYIPVQMQCAGNEEKNDVKIIAFVSNSETDFAFYHRQTYRHLNIYQAYFENCAYSYIMEFFVQEPEAIALITQLKTRPGVDAAIYKQCHTLHLEKAVD